MSAFLGRNVWWLDIRVVGKKPNRTQLVQLNRLLRELFSHHRVGRPPR